MCCVVLQKHSESWYVRLFAINFLRRHVNKYFRLWRRAAPPVGPLQPQVPPVCAEWLQLAPALCWRRRRPGPSSRGRADGWRSNRRAARDRSCRDGASQRRWALTALGHTFFFVFRKSETDQKKVRNHFKKSETEKPKKSEKKSETSENEIYSTDQ